MAASNVPRGVGYPVWFRQRIIDTPGSAKMRAWHYKVSLVTVYRLDRLFAQTGSVLRRSFRGGAPRIMTPLNDERVRVMTMGNPRVRRDEIQKALRALGVSVHATTISRSWKRIGFTYKRLRRFARSRDEQRRVFFWINGPVGPRGVAGVFGVPTLEMIDIDEAGIELTECDPHFGHALKGQRAQAPGWVRKLCCLDDKCCVTFLRWILAIAHEQALQPSSRHRHQRRARCLVDLRREHRRRVVCLFHPRIPPAAPHRWRSTHNPLGQPFVALYWQHCH